MSVKVSKATIRGWIKSVQERAAEGRLPSLAQRREEIERVEPDADDPLAGPSKAKAATPVAAPFAFFREDDAARKGGAGKGAAYGFTDARDAVEALVGTVPGSGELPQLCGDADVRLHKRFQDLNDALVMVKAIKKDAWNPGASRAYAELRQIGGALARKILYSSYTGYGAEFIPDTLSAALIPLFRERRSLVGMFTTLNLPTSPYNFPVQGADTTAYLTTESTSDDPASSSNAIGARTVATSKVTFTAKGFKVRGLVSAEQEEDGIISTVDYLRGMLVQAQIDSLETAAINGDTAGSHMDTDISSGTDCRKAFDGLRKLCTSAAKINAGGDKLTVNDILTARTKMGKFASDQGNCAIILSQIGLTHIVGSDAFIAADKAGPGLSLLTGAVWQVLGMPVVTSGFVREDLGGAGIYAASATRTHALVVHRPSFAFGMRRGMTLASMFDIQTDRHILVSTMRVDFQRIQAEVTSGSTRAYNIVNIYNIDKTATF